MQIVDHNTILALGISPLQMYQWTETMIQNKHNAVLPPKISMKQEENGFYNVMPCMLPEINRMGVKIINRNSGRTQGPSLTSQILLYELSSGKPLTLFDGSYITAIRTGAVAAHSVQLFARKDFSSIGLIGLGTTATATMDVLLTIMPEREMDVHLLRYKDQAERFIRRYAQNPKLRFIVHDSAGELIRNSQVIISCVTYMDHCFADESAFQPGCTVIPVHTRGFQNCDTAFDKVFADDIGHVRGFQNFEKFKSIVEVSDVVNGRAVGRTNDQERILVYNIGLAIHDIYFADQIFRLNPSGQTVSLEGPDEKSWLPLVKE